MTTRTFGEQVLGRRCLILFEVDDGSRVPYAGKITEYKAVLKGNKNIERTHHVHFDDGDTKWFDLAYEKEAGQLWWDDIVEDDDRKPAAAKQAKRKRKKAPAATLPPAEEDAQEDKEEAKEDAEIPAMPKKKKHRTKAPVITPTRTAQRTSDDPDWVKRMAEWLETVPHGRKNKVCSAANARTVMSKVCRLVSGDGITYNQLPDDVVFCEGV